MQITIDLSGSNSEKIAAMRLRNFANLLDPQSAAAATIETEETSEHDISTMKADADEAPKKRGRPKKEETTDEDTQEEFDLGDAEEVEEPKKMKAITEDDMIKAFKAYANEHSREKAGKILAKFGVKSVRDLKAAEYGKVLKTLQG